jgi:cyclase
MVADGEGKRLAESGAGNSCGDLKVSEPHPGILAFYDGRAPEASLEGVDWVGYDLALGIASYALVEGSEALVYDTHTSPDRGEFVRAELERRGVRELTVALSHWHLDHIAGAHAFTGCEVVSTSRTAEHLAERRRAIELGQELGPPAIASVVSPTRTFEDRLPLSVGSRAAELIHFNIHSDDAAVLWLPDEGVLLAGDTLEDTVTFVDEPDSVEVHLGELERMARLRPARILPAHGDPGVIGRGGYSPEFIDATRDYLERLLAARSNPALRELPLSEFVAEALRDGTLVYHEPYEIVHRDNVKKVAMR